MEKRKKFYRSQTDKIISGVAGGVAEYLEVDSTIVRLAFVLIALVAQVIPAIIVYIIAAIVIPKNPLGPESETEEGEQKSEAETATRADTAKDKKTRQGPTARNIFGVVLIIVGVLALLGGIFHFSFFVGKIILPVVLILIGVLIISRARRKHDGRN